MRLLPALLALAACSEPAPPAPVPAAPQDHLLDLPPAPDGPAAFTPPGRDEIPEGPFGDAVRRGRAAFTDTAAQAGPYMGNTLSCSNCHLDEGRRPDSAPMWAAWGQYPAFRKKNDRVNTMEDRLLGCFTYSLNAQDSETGGPPPRGSQVLTDLQAYLFWLAQGTPTGRALPGRGYPALEAPPQPPDVGRGQQVFAERCAVCHGEDGQGAQAEGQDVFPPLWGPRSFNWGAGMHRVNTAAGFIQANMPLGQPGSLTVQQAWDVAQFIGAQPRPADPRAAEAGAGTDARFHDHDCLYGETVDGHRLGEGG
ncbi:MAG: c-type cytochrome [Alphaproteobacteria bacterium]|nr:c-type cytochrome [Alphaproteobacteria bacterium]